ncbi:aldehyde dehydrogenase (NAD+) [Pseudonocardia kunmingensis]|uniref:Aldehyde dehydrogenase (NAD+) n=1 Tax=Pseudonocardia kunmingensis TaxID=630975 RepID=A0A543D364_9PSEU|nr:aldehyde dehydrogenase family protein [Pseudonocardia kunmingensis]TQM03780.1 aldehyde dehydrogenase (NAD+) [Pseudonocardia kunmingensis]
MTDTRMLIGGGRPAVDPATSMAVTSPVDGRELGRIADATADQVHDAVTAATDAFRAWRRTSGAERARLMHLLADLLERDAEELALLETSDNGKLLRETRTQARFAARNYRFFAGLADKIHGRTVPLDAWDTFDYTVREPVGVAALITAWNSPMQLLANKLAPALAAGCTVVVKPSELAPLTTLRMAELVTEAGFPDGVVNIVTGGAEAGVALTTDPRLGRISFTGSVETGQAIQRAATAALVPVTLELGGKSANIVFDDADLERALPVAVAGIFAAGGQTCIAGSRLLVHERVHDRSCEQVAETARRIVLGDPTDDATQMARWRARRSGCGSRPHRPRPHRRCAAADRRWHSRRRRTSPRLLRRADGLRARRSGVGPRQQEVFGPVLATPPVADEEEASPSANVTEYGLAQRQSGPRMSPAHTGSARELAAGTVWVNTYRYSAAQAPFGVVKKSGYGRERGVEAIDEYLHTKNVLIDLSDEVRDPFAIKADGGRHDHHPDRPLRARPDGLPVAGRLATAHDVLA